MDAVKYRSSAAEQARTEDLMRILPEGRQTVLEIGARDGYFSRLLADCFDEVTALDLEKPNFEIPQVLTVRGDVTNLDFPDDSFDCVFCTEVLEHIPQLQRAADEISRVARHEVVIGVPYRQDIRIGRTTCQSCGGINPPWGHVNAFDEKKLVALFPCLELRMKSLVWENRGRTNPVSTWLMDAAGNPWGTYNQDEPCLHCGANLVAPTSRSLNRRVMTLAAHLLCKLQSPLVRPQANWIHVVFRKR